jgi:hypothetical protein
MGLLWAVPAAAQSHRVPLEVENFTLRNYCDFPVSVEWTDFNQYIVRTTTDPITGATTYQISGHATIRLTNTRTGESVSYNISGPGTFTQNTDGSFSFDSHGPNLFWTLPRLSYPGVPYISYTTGHITLSVNSRGLTTSYQLSGTQTDVCAVLA